MAGFGLQFPHRPSVAHRLKILFSEKVLGLLRLVRPRIDFGIRIRPDHILNQSCPSAISPAICCYFNRHNENTFRTFLNKQGTQDLIPIVFSNKQSCRRVLRREFYEGSPKTISKTWLNASISFLFAPPVDRLQLFLLIIYNSYRHRRGGGGLFRRLKTAAVPYFGPVSSLS